MDYQAVIDEILLRAGSPDIDAIEKALARLRETFSDLKERGISLLTAALAGSQDAFLARKLKQIADLIIADRNAIAQTLIPDSGLEPRFLLIPTEAATFNEMMSPLITR